MLPIKLNEEQQQRLKELCTIYLYDYVDNTEFDKNMEITYRYSLDTTLMKFWRSDGVLEIPWWELVTYHLPIKMLGVNSAIVGFTANMMGAMLKGENPVDYLYNKHKTIIKTCVG